MMGDISKRTPMVVSLYPTDRLYPLSAPLPPSSMLYDMKEDLFERDEDRSQEMDKEVPFDAACPSYTPSRQPATFSLNLNAIAEDEEVEDEIYFPSYDDVECSDEVDYMKSLGETAPDEPRPVSPCPVERPVDDSAIRVQPSRHVDYLSHDWNEEDLWSTWRHIVSKRGEYGNSARLENASWRSWGKKRFNLKTVSPETVKWLKDHDLTWLYGPLTPGSCSFDEPCPSKSNRPNADVPSHNRKPILKKRSLSEIMLQRSISSSTLLRHAAVAKFCKDSLPLSLHFESPYLNTGVLPSAFKSGLENASGWKKVQFHELVEQCIVLVNMNDDEHEYHYCNESDDDVVVMRKSKKRATGKGLPAIPTKQSCSSTTIGKLPHARLKYSEEFEELHGESISDEFCTSGSSSPTSLADIPSNSFDPVMLGEDSDEEDDWNWQPQQWLRGRKDSVHIAKDRMSDIRMHMEEAVVEPSDPDKPHLERNIAIKEQENVLEGPSNAVEERGASVKFELPTCLSQLAVFSSGAPSKTPGVEDDYFMVDPGMTEDESEDSLDMSRSSSQSSDQSDPSDESGVKLDPIKESLVGRVMDEFWIIFNQRWDTSVGQSNIASPTSPRTTSTPHPYPSARKRWSSGDKEVSSRSGQHRRTSDKLNSLEGTPGTPQSPDSKELADYDSFIRRELPSAVQLHIKQLISLDNDPSEFSLIRNLVNIIHDCRDKMFQSYAVPTDRDDGAQGLGITSLDPFPPSRLNIDTSHHSELLNAAYKPPPSKYTGNRNYQTALKESTPSLTHPAASLATPSVCPNSGYTIEIPSLITSPDPSKLGTDSHKYLLPRDLSGNVGLAERDWDWEMYDDFDKAVTWSRGY